MFTQRVNQTTIKFWQNCQDNIVRFERQEMHDKGQTLSDEGWDG